MSDFQSKLAASLTAAKSTLDEGEQEASNAAEAAREKARVDGERFAAIKSCAQRFKHNKLEPLFREVLQQMGEKGFAVGGGYLNEDGDTSGIVGSTIETGGDWVIRAAIFYGLEKSTARVDGQTASGPCYAAADTFEEATSLEWFEDRVAEAAGKVMATNELPRANIVRYKGRNA